MPSVPCQLLEWDSEFFGRKIARLTTNHLRADELPLIIEWCLARGVDCLYFLADIDDLQTTDLAAQHQFRFVDLRVTLENRRLAATVKGRIPAESDEEIRPFQPEDLPVLREIAAYSHGDSRFLVDRHFPEERSREMFRIWIGKSCGAEGGKVLVAEHAGRPAGYIACRVIKEAAGQIDLLGVDGAVRGRGLGRKLIVAGLEWLASQGMSRATVVTQGRNVAAQGVYQRCGFITQATQFWYHRWFESAVESERPVEL